MPTEVSNNKWGSNRFWNRLATVSGIFALLVCFLLIANYIQIKKSDPVNMTVVGNLVERLRQDPSDSLLRREIRTLDLLSRKAYFTSLWQIKTGGYMILAAVALTILSLQVVEYRKKVNPAYEAKPEDETMLQRLKARKWIVTGAVAILVLAIVFGFLASGDLADNFTKLANGELPDSSLNDEAAVETVSISSDTLASGSMTAAVADSSAATAPVVISTDNFQNFRGNSGSINKKDIPVSWDGAAGTNILWKTEIPLPGFNSPVVWGERVFLTGATPEKQEIYCIDKNSGTIKWSVAVGKGVKKPSVNVETGYSAPTAVADARGVYAIFATGDIAAVDNEGNKIWERDLGLPKNYYGYSSSLLIYKDNIIVQFDQTEGPVVMALSATTGKTVWSTARPVKISWSSPILVNTGKRNELILVAEPFVISYNPANGQEIWRVECISGEVGPSLAYSNGIVFSVNDYSVLSAIKSGDQPSILWQNNDYLSDIPSPAANDKYLFLPTSYGTVVCYDALTGEKYWENDMGTNIFSSPMIVEGKVYILDRHGITHIIKADKEYKVIAEAKLGEESACTPAFTNGRIYIRGEKHLYCIGK